MYKFRVTDLPLNKNLSIALKSINGLSWHKIRFILSRLGIAHSILVENLNLYYKDLLFFYLENFVMSIACINRYTDLRIKKLISLNTYKGIRHELFLPVHGQRTRTNANTQRSKRRLIIELDKINVKSSKFRKK